MIRYRDGFRFHYLGSFPLLSRPPSTSAYPAINFFLVSRRSALSPLNGRPFLSSRPQLSSTGQLSPPSFSFVRFSKLDSHEFMANIVQFSVDNTSPQISYFPFADTLSTPNLSAGWNPYFSLSGFAGVLGESGNGTSHHITSLDGASLSIHWRGTGIQLQGNATNASYSLLLDGAAIKPDVVDYSNSILATIQGLPDVEHTISLTTQIPSSQDPPNSSIVVFDRAIIISTITNDTFPDENFTLRTLNDNDIAYLGQWSFQNTSGVSFHQSSTVGDRALVTFNGNYTVTLDNISTSLSGKSSFAAHDTLLFFASDLDPNSNHSVEIRNDGGGNLALLVGGFNAYATGAILNDSIETPKSSNISTSFPKGTIAAFTLAGILAFLGISGFLFFFLVYRPRRRRRRLSRAAFRFRQRPPSSYKEHEAVLDIGPRGSGDDDLVIDVSNANSLHRGSSKGGYALWKLEGAVPTAGTLGVDFRHSDSFMQGKYGSAKYDEELAFEELEPFSARSCPSTKGKRSLRNKGKAKRATDGSWSPSFTIELPLEGPHSTPEGDHSSAIHGHGIESLSYMSPPKSPTREPSHNPPPPSYAASVSNRASNRSSNPSVPRSISHSTVSSPVPTPKVPSLQDLPYADLNPRSTEDNTVPPPLPVYYPLESMSREDRGSIVGSSTDDHRSMIAGSVVNQVLRSLSPRTSVLEITPPKQQQQHKEERKRKKKEKVLGEASTRGSPSPIQIPKRDHEHASSSSQEPTKVKRSRKGGKKVSSRPSTANEMVEVQDGVFLSVPETSPFRVDFAESSLVIPPRRASTSKRDSSLSPVRFDFGQSDEGPSSPQEQQQPEELVPAMSSRQAFRLTPASIHPLNLGHSLSRNSTIAESFIDFTSSSENSLRPRSGISSATRERHWDASTMPDMPGDSRSRWSNTTMSTSHDRIGTAGTFGPPPPLLAPQPNMPVTIPFLLTIPSNSSAASADGDDVDDVASNDHSSNLNHQRQSHLSVGSQQPSDALHVHPRFESLESPTDSVRMSITSDLRFRHSDSHESRRTSSFTAPIGREHGYAAFPPELAERFGPLSPAISTPGYIVQRVLGIQTPTSTSSAGVRPGHSRSGSSTLALIMDGTLYLLTLICLERTFAWTFHASL
ncbi:uncharacterized protein LACBIDRAFT_324293 [Laccaria bicolor S238N-H82]|uniref:Predicted protein n=1 Tax=Laccaria bicolor (strain S238N-H82 / ATCC MYA-4686) TaxID=486041 RepID=B0D1D0_LACBS|nr:uncharacterized protein LACBIDRAFT_324293 [Laccaria bicolor S238N-H82]EDR11612.1 predicted protein [Laccaria bicolor S238N-H82]|eukprot:XP_001877509.1 predicted protein [Laccaria bicolor S238N-H82]